MRRRAVVRALVAALSGLAGCSGDLPRATGPRTPPEPSSPPSSAADEPTVSDIDVEPTDDGRLRVVATVRNPRSAPITPTVVVRVTVDDAERVRRTDLEVPANDVASARIDFDVTFDAFSSDGGVTASLE
jgi:multidrug efflux pump subunit AcrA (membrane-fusion protein)